MRNIWLVEAATRTAEGTEQNWNCVFAVTDYIEELKSVRDLNRENLAELREGHTRTTAVFRLKQTKLYGKINGRFI